MSTRRFMTKNKTALYVIAVVVIIVAFLLLGGGPWIRGIMHGNRSIGMGHLNWVQILISFGLGFQEEMVINGRNSVISNGCRAGLLQKFSYKSNIFKTC